MSDLDEHCSSTRRALPAGSRPCPPVVAARRHRPARPIRSVGDRIRYRSGLLPPVRAMVRLTGRSRPPARPHRGFLPGGDGVVPQSAVGRRGLVPIDRHPPERDLPALTGATGSARGRSGALQDRPLASLASAAHTIGSAPERTRLRRAALDAGRATRAAQRDQVLARRLRKLGFDDLPGYLHHAHSTGESLRSIAKATGLGWARMRRELDAAGIAARPASQLGCTPAVIAR